MPSWKSYIEGYIYYIYLGLIFCHICFILLYIGPLSAAVIDPPITKIGTEVTITCTLTGSPAALSVKWKKGGSDLDTSDSNKYSGGTKDTPSLSIKNVAQSDEGSYQCVATNAGGTTESTPTLLFVIGLYYIDVALIGGLSQCFVRHPSVLSTSSPKLLDKFGLDKKKVPNVLNQV